MASSVLSREQELPPSTCWQSFPSATQEALGLLCDKAELLVHSQLVYQDPQLLPCRAAFQMVNPLCVLTHRVIPPQRQGLVLPFVELREVKHFPLHISMLTNSNHFLVLHLFGKGSQGLVAPSPSQGSR